MRLPLVITPPSGARCSCCEERRPLLREGVSGPSLLREGVSGPPSPVSVRLDLREGVSGPSLLREGVSGPPSPVSVRLDLREGVSGPSLVSDRLDSRRGVRAAAASASSTRVSSKHSTV
jgi:hypothetical protein